MRIRIFRDWNPSYKCDYNYKNIQIVNDDSYEAAILFNIPMCKLKSLPKEKVLGLAWEPSKFRNYRKYIDFANKHIGAYLLGNPNVYGINMGDSFIEHHAWMYDCRPVTKDMDTKSPFYRISSSYESISEKTHPICMIATKKAMLTGHKKRHDLIKNILASDLDIHIYGRTISSLFKDNRVKGGFALHPDVYPKYYFDVSIENCREGSYISEKLWNPTSHRTCPIYWGSDKVRDYANDFFYKLPDDIDDAMDMLKLISKDPDKYYQTKSQTLIDASEFLRNYNYLDFAYAYFKTGKLPTVRV